MTVTHKGRLPAKLSLENLAWDRAVFCTRTILLCVLALTRRESRRPDKLVTGKNRKVDFQQRDFVT